MKNRMHGLPPELCVIAGGRLVLPPQSKRRALSGRRASPAR